MASDQPDIKPLQNGFPPLHILSAVNTSVTSTPTPIVAGTSFIPVFQPGMFGSGIIGLPLTLGQQALFQANMDAAANSAKTSTSTIISALQENQGSSSSLNEDSKPSLKRKYTESLLNKSPGSSTVHIEDDFVKTLPRTKKGKVYSWMWSAHPKRQRARITEKMKREIIEFCKNHAMLKQGEIADIFGVDRTTVTKLLKRSHEINGEEEPVYNPCRKYSNPQYELEDMLYRWISNSTKHPSINQHQPVWSCEQLLEQAEDLNNLTETRDEFYPDMDWLIDFIERFKLKRFITDFPTDYKRAKTKSPSVRKVLPKPVQNDNNSQQHEDLTSAMLSSHKIPKEPEAEYTIVETPLDIPMKIEPGEVKKDVNVEELTSEEALNREIKQLDKFREQQKAIEEANKLKKDLLAKTLSERKKRAKQEAYKLEHIQKELSKLDHLLTADVNVVREKIEEASREFLEAQKRFQRAEKEYVESKIDLHNKSEIKEHLTEHLYTIIHQNEVRKAQKLADLMKELEMENGDDDVSIQLPELPPLTSFQQTNLHLSPTTGQTVIEQTKMKVPGSASCSDGGKSPENCDKNSNTIVIQPNSPEDTSGVKSTLNEDGVENLSENSDKPIPSFTIVEDGEPVSIVYDEEADTKMKESNKELIKQTEESQNKEDEKSVTEQGKCDTVVPKVKTKWDFDGSLK